MKKIAIELCIILMLMLPSISAITVDESSSIELEKTSDKTIFIEDELDIIFSDLQEKMENVDTQEECNILFKETIIKLDNCDLLGGFSVDDAYKIVSSSDNTYSITGESSNTNFLESRGVYWYDIYKHEYLPKWRWTLSGILWPIYLELIKLPYHTSSWITFGYGIGNWEGRIDEYIPAEGYINIVTSEGEEEYNGNFYGHIHGLDGFGGYPSIDNLRYHYVGIKGFKGWNIGNYYFGTAEVIDIGYSHP